MDTGFWLTDTRYYKARIAHDLWGGVEVQLAWGGRRSRRGGMKRMVVFSTAEAEEVLNRVDRRRRARGYEPALPKIR